MRSARLDTLDERARSIALGVARITVGSMWLANLHWKVPPDFGEDTGGGLYKYAASVSRNSPFAPFTWVTEEIILPNFQLFGWITLLSELVIATLLLAGYLTRIAALGGALMTIPIFLSVIYYDRTDEWSWSYLLMFAAHLFIYGSLAGRHLGIDGVVTGDGDRRRRATMWVGGLATSIGLAGLWVSRSVDVVGREVALLGSDAGFVDDQGQLVRRWELKFVWFNPAWALLSVAVGALALAAVKLRWSRLAAGALSAALAIVILLVQTFEYLRDDGEVQVIATASNAAMWAAFAVALLMIERAERADRR